MAENAIQIKSGITLNIGVSTKSTLTNFYILRAFLLIAIALLIDVSIYCYLMKYKANQKDLLPYYITNDKLKRFYINKCIIIWRVMMN